MELLVFGHAGAKVIVFPTREGRFYEYENLRMTEVLRDKLEKGFLQLFCVDGIDSESFYCRWAHPSGRIQRHRQYEEYILNEVLPFMGLKNPHPCVIVHGCSLGACHALNIAMRHPHLFRKLAAFSGRYDLTINVEGFPDLFEGYYNEDVYFHTPTHFLPNLTCAQRLAHLRNMAAKAKDFPLFVRRSTFTDDTVLTVAVASAIRERVERELEIVRQRVIRMIHEVVHDENVPGFARQIFLARVLCPPANSQRRENECKTAQRRRSKKYMLGSLVLRNEGCPALERDYGRFGGELPQCFRRKSLKKRNLDYLFNGGHARISDPFRENNEYLS
jgi:esterase/lipase superfamily enzyme